MSAITIKNLNIDVNISRKKKHNILHKINLEIPENSIFGFIGANGAGKTTTINAIIGQFPITSGKIFLFDQKFNSKLTKYIGYSPDEAIYYEHLTGIEHLILLGQLSNINKKEAKKRGITLLQKLGLTYAQNRKVQAYSKGMKQRLGLAIALINDPKLLILDEPMNGLDPLGRKLVKELILSLKKQGKTIFFATHILSDVEEIADEFAIIHKGNILLKQNINTLTESLENTFIKQIQQINLYPHIVWKDKHHF